MKFGSKCGPEDINYNKIKQLCGTQEFFESFHNEIVSWNGDSARLEQNFLGALKLIKKHQKILMTTRAAGAALVQATQDDYNTQKIDIFIETLSKSNPIFSQSYQRLTHKFSRKYPEFFLMRSSLLMQATKSRSFQTIAHRAFEPYLHNLSNNWQIRQKTDWIEIDVTICKTGEVILQHDRYHDDGRPLENVALSELKNPVTLADLVSKWHQIQLEMADNSPKLMIDVKGWNSTDIIASINRVLTRFKINNDNVLIASFNQCYVMKSKRLGYKTAFITANREEYHFLHFMKHYRIDLIILDENIACQDAIDTYHQHEIDVWVYTVNKMGRFDYMIDIGVDGIITDYPNLLFILMGR